jgi:hypothetical protein
MADERWARRLTNEELSTLEEKGLGREHGHFTVTLIVEFFDLALREIGSSWAAEESIDPVSFKIDSDQWLIMSKWCAHHDGVDGGLTWMNVGPSSREVALT